MGGDFKDAKVLQTLSLGNKKLLLSPPFFVCFFPSIFPCPFSFFIFSPSKLVMRRFVRCILANVHVDTRRS